MGGMEDEDVLSILMLSDLAKANPALARHLVELNEQQLEQLRKKAANDNTETREEA